MLDEARSHFSELPIWHDLMAELGRQTPRILAEQRADAVKEGVDKAVEDLLAAAAAHLPPETIEKLRLQRDPAAIITAVAAARK